MPVYLDCRDMHPGRAFRNEVFMDIFTGSIDERLNAVNKLLNMESNFDIIQRNLTIGNKRAQMECHRIYRIL